MAKKRTVRKVARKKAAKPARRRASRRSKSVSDAEETMNIIAGILVVVLIGLGIYFYQTTQKKTGAIEPPMKMAMVVQS